MEEYTKHPTRGNHLLGLASSNLDGNLSTKVFPGISDHMAVLSKLSLPIYSDHAVERYSYFYKQADWKGLNYVFSNVGWTFLFTIEGINEYVEEFTGFVISAAPKIIPYGKSMY